MNYTIDIIDNQNSEVVLSLEKAIAESVILSWQGSDKKDERSLIGSSLSFTMAGDSCEDGQYYDLFTGDETRYRVHIYTEENITIWNGNLLPDAYSEPYKDAPIEVDFQATDGIGRLKGKYLPADYYEEEKSVIKVIGKCLSLTGVDMQIRFAPAIENTQQKDYNQIFIDTADFVKGDKKEDAHKILSDLMHSMCCMVFQCDDHWNVEGLNIREQRVYNTKIYTYQGDLVDQQEITRLKKEITPIVTPLITMQPPYGIVRIEHQRNPVSFPDTISEEKNDGWIAPRNSFHYIYATDWYGYNDFYAKAAEYPDDPYTTMPDRDALKVYFGRGDQSTKYITLRNRPYLRKNGKYKLKLDFRLLPYIELTEGSKETLIDNGFWTNPFLIRISIRSKNSEGQTVVDTLFANYGVSEDGTRYIEQAFDEEEVYKNNLEFIAPVSGQLDIQISPVHDSGLENNNQIEYVAIEEASLEDVDFEGDYIAEILSNEDYTTKKEETLVYGDSTDGFSRGFRLQKLRGKSNYNELDVPILRSFTRDGYYYLSVPLQSANAVKENPKEFYSGTNNINVTDVIYNYNNSEDHVIKTTNPVTAGILNVRAYNYNSVTENRDYWQQWTDSLYKVERLRYPDAYANICDRLFNKPIPGIQNFSVKNNIKLNDFINFTYRSNSEWIITNCRWNIDKGFSDVTCIQSYYGVTPQENIPPVVEAGDDIQIDGTGTTLQLTSEAYDPDGFIVSYEWQEVTNTGATINSPNSQNTGISNFTGDFATFIITVTDNQGATASDTVNVFRVQDHALELETITDDGDSASYKLGFSPEIAEGASLNIKGSISVNLNRTEFTSGNAYSRIKRDGVTTHSLQVQYDGQGSSQNEGHSLEFSLNYYNGDEIIFEISASATYPDSAYADFVIDTVEFVEGQGDITGTPQNKVKN